MRLNAKEIKAIRDAFQFLPPIKEEFNLYLFGSRVDDKKKGGDIDLLVVTNKKSKSQFIDLKSKIKLRIFETLGEQKIDITVATENDLTTDPFLKSIFPKAEKLI